MRLRDLRPISFLDLDQDDAISIVKEVRFRRRQQLVLTPTRVKKVKPLVVKTVSNVDKLIANMSHADIQRFLQLIKEP